MIFNVLRLRARAHFESKTPCRNIFNWKFRL